MIVLIEKIADYIIPEDNAIRKGLGEIMGGKILKLRDVYKRQGYGSLIQGSSFRRLQAFLLQTCLLYTSEIFYFLYTN